ncbi:unnamed protein product [Caenorhabditis bovis]|uniref:F-box domain-containing protein n=1 Tax=Caenorhabditis bovis TaxID=2654633 RepID=A0A8S1E0F9_9PELO|nr:unnamed protein product [Caenorhabditis bovis]
MDKNSSKCDLKRSIGRDDGANCPKRQKIFSDGELGKIPTHVMQMIIEYLSLDDQKSFRSVCKWIAEVISIIFFDH